MKLVDGKICIPWAMSVFPTLASPATGDAAPKTASESRERIVEAFMVKMRLGA
jgi:hypothetical protein